MQTPEAYPGLNSWIKNVSVKSLVHQQLHPHEHVSKAGIIPFFVQDGLRQYMVMRPVAHHPELGLPAFQICKGTRLCYTKDSKGNIIAQDMTVLYKTGNFDGIMLEPPLQAALREGREEIGLKHENIAYLYDAGITSFTSVRTGKSKPMYLFAATIKAMDDFDAPDEKEAATEETRWMTLEAFAQQGRKDHYTILKQLDGQLSTL